MTASTTVAEFCDSNRMNSLAKLKNIYCLAKYFTESVCQLARWLSDLFFFFLFTSDHVVLLILLKSLTHIQSLPFRLWSPGGWSLPLAFHPQAPCHWLPLGGGVGADKWEALAWDGRAVPSEGQFWQSSSPFWLVRFWQKLPFSIMTTSDG